MFEHITKDFDDAATAYTKLKQTVGKQLAKEYATIGPKLGSRIVSFSWDQYTPSFNDGDTCYFGVYEVSYLNVLDAEGEETELDIGWVDPSNVVADFKDEDPELAEQVLAALKIIKDVNKFNDEHTDLLEEAFGDHRRVTVSKTGIDLDYCDHD